MFHLEVFVIYEFSLAEKLLVPAQVTQGGKGIEMLMPGLFFLLVEVGAVLLIRLRGAVFKEGPMFL